MASATKPETKLDARTTAELDLYKLDMTNFGKVMNDENATPEQRKIAMQLYNTAREAYSARLGGSTAPPPTAPPPTAPPPTAPLPTTGDLSTIADEVQAEQGGGAAPSAGPAPAPAPVPGRGSGERRPGLITAPSVEPPSGNEPTYSPYRGNVFSTMMQRAGEYSGISAAENLIEAKRQGKPYATSDIQAVAEAVMEQKIALKDLPTNVQQAVISAINRNR
jgi:hypothetical protein